MPTYDAIKNFAKATVSIGYDDIATSIVLATGDGAKLPQPSTDGQYNLTWWNYTDYKDPSDDPNVEIIRVTARSTDTLTITRAQEGTTASVKNTASKTYKVALTVTTKTINDVENNTRDAVSTFIASTKGYLTCGTAGSLANFQAVANGSFRTSIDGTNRNIDGIDLTNAVGSATSLVSQTAASASYYSLSPFEIAGQSFKTGANQKTINSIKVKVNTGGSSNRIYAELRTGSNPNSGTVIASKNISVNYSSPTVITISFSETAVSSNTTYSIAVYFDGSIGSRNVYHDTDLYADGIAYKGTTANSGDDLYFDIIGKEITYDAIATAIQNAIQTVTGGAETCVYSTDHLLITSGINGSTSEISLLTTSTGTIGTDISGSLYMNGRSGSGVATAGTGNDGKVPLINNDGVVPGTLIGGAFGTVVSKSDNVNYLAETDGFVLCLSNNMNHSYIYSDAIATPTTIVLDVYLQGTFALRTSMIYPVKKGDYWRTQNCTSVKWCPLGN